MKRYTWRTVSVLLAALALSAATAGASEAPSMALELKPLPGEDGRTVVWLEVGETIGPISAAAGETLLELASVTFNVPGIGSQAEVFDARDEAGALQLENRTQGEGDSAVLQWYADRAVTGSLAVRYRVPTETVAAPRGPAPPTELRNDAEALSGAGSNFVLRPPEGEYLFQVAWDLSALPKGVTAVSSLGYGPSEPMPVGTLDSVYFMAGRLGHFPQDTDERGFYSAWQGEPPFDATQLMSTARTLREGFIKFFNAAPGGYGIMMRPNPVNAGGGIGLHRSFVVTFDKNTDAADLAFTLSHEMFHTFQPRLDAGGGPNSSLSNAWFNEGLAVFYQREFLLRADLIGLDAYLQDLNTYAARYYTNALGNTPNSEVAAGFWRDTRIRTLPYDRGFLYFVTVDEAVREASGGSRSLDDLAKAMRRLQDAGQPLTQADWERLIGQELGEDAIAALHAMLDGAAPLPSPAAFGACFTRTSKPLRRYELGFDPAVLTEEGRIVHGLVEGSEAQRSGLRNGDSILKPVPQDAIQGDQQAYLSLLVQRDGKEFEVRYLPRGETVPAWQWERVAGLTDEDCRSGRFSEGRVN